MGSKKLLSFSFNVLKEAVARTRCVIGGRGLGGGGGVKGIQCKVSLVGFCVEEYGG